MNFKQFLFLLCSCVALNAFAQSEQNPVNYSGGIHDFMSGLAEGSSGARYVNRGSNKKKIKDTDISTLGNATDSEIANLAAMVLQHNYVQINPQSKTFTPFTKMDMEQFTLHYQVPEKSVDFEGNYFILSTLDMSGKMLKEAAREAANSHGLIVLKGLKNNSIAATFEAASVMADEGATVILAPFLFKKFGAKYSPSLTYTIKYNHDYMMTHGFVGISGRMIVLNLSKMPENETELAEYYKNHKMNAGSYNQFYRKLPVENQTKFVKP